jgi:hypothetical protein
MLAYESDQEILNLNDVDVDEVVNEFSLRMRERGRQYIRVASFENLNEMKQRMDECWKKNTSHETERGFKQFFYCKYDRANCPKRAYLFYDNQNDKIELFENQSEHCHITTPRGLTREQKELTKRLYAQGVTKPSLILRAFEQENTPTPKKDKLVTFLSGHKEKTYGKNQISLGELSKWCQDNSTRPEDIDQPFVFFK